MNGQTFSELKEMGTSAHLAGYSDRAHPDAERPSDADHGYEHDHGTDPQDQASVAGSHTHKDRHAPGESEHEHSHAARAVAFKLGALVASSSTHFLVSQLIPH